MSIERSLPPMNSTYSQAWLQEILNHLPTICANLGIALCKISPEGEFIHVTQMLCEILGYTEEELFKTNLRALIFPADLSTPKADQLNAFLLSNERNFIQLDLPYIHKQGHLIWGKITIMSARNTAGNVEYFIAAVENITERKLSEELLHLQNGVLEHMATNSPLAETLERIVYMMEKQAPGAWCTISLVEGDRLFFRAAPRFPQSLIENQEGLQIHPHFSGSCGAAAFYAKRIVSPDIEHDEYWTTLRPWMLSNGFRSAWSTPVLSKEGKVIGTASMCWKQPTEPTQRHFELADVATKLVGMAVERDRTEKLVLEQQVKMITTSKLAALGEMAGGLAHEINNPLAIISGRAVQLTMANEQGRLNLELINDIATSIQSTTMRISKIIKGLISFARENEQEEKREVLLDTLIEDTLSFCRERFKSHAVDLTVKSSQDVKIQCRPVQLSQVLLNLLNNSYDAIEELSEKWVKIEVEKNSDSIYIAVTDSGQGIPEQLRDKIIQPFFTTKDVNRGTGLGLSISAGIISSHQGTLNLDTNSKNTRFVISLPNNEVKPECAKF